MKKRLVMLVCLLSTMAAIAADPLAAEWRAVDEALGKKHSRSAVALLQKVEAKALELKRWPDYTAARLRRLHLDYSLAEDDVLKRHCSDGVLEKFAGEVEAAPVEVRAMLRLALMPYYAELAFDDCSDERFRTKIVGEVATNYYIDQLPQGCFVLETSFRVRQRGVFTSGLASVQCLYAPEFGAHSAASVLTVVATK